MANNVFEQTTEEELHLSSNQTVSRAIENLLGFTSPENFERFQNKYSENLRPICSDTFASHILQKMIEISFLRAVGNKKENKDDSEQQQKRPKTNILSEKEYNTTTEFSDQHKEACSSFLIRIGKFLLNNLEDFIWDSSANHIMRTSVLCLAGVHISKARFKENNEEIESIYSVPEEWSTIVVEYANRLQLWPQFSEFPYSQLSSCFIGALCTAVWRVNKKFLKHFGKKILFNGFLKTDGEDDKKKIDITDEQENQNNETILPEVFRSSSAVRLLETLLKIAGRKLFCQLYSMLFLGRLKILALTQQTNFAVQILIENVKEKTDFEAIFTELSEHIEEILKSGHTGVVNVLSGGCLKFVTKQAALITALQNALHIEKSTEISSRLFISLLKLKPVQLAVKDESQFIHLHGSLIIQNILKFNKPILLVNSILAVPPNDLAEMLSTQKGSRIADAFLESKFIGEKSREKLIRHLNDNYVEMAISKCGSYEVEKLFEASSEAQKCKIANELVGKINKLNGNMFGRILIHKLRLETYRLSAEKWKATLNRNNKTEKMFKNFLEI